MRPVPTGPCLGLIHAFEGKGGAFEPTRTQDPAGNWEIGWSHKLSGPDDPLWDQTLDAAAADALAIEDLAGAARGVCNALGNAVMSLDDNEYAALIDFAYNEGVAAFTGSTLCRLILAGDLDAADAQFARWVDANIDGKEEVLQGLVRRRAAEARLWAS